MSEHGACRDLLFGSRRLLFFGSIIYCLLDMLHIPACSMCMWTTATQATSSDQSSTREQGTGAYCWTFALLFLFFRPNVLSSATYTVKGVKLQRLMRMGMCNLQKT